jgi:hypothetical protein
LFTFVTGFFFLRWGVVSPKPNPQVGGPPLVGSPRLLIQYFRSSPPKLEGVSSIRNLRTFLSDKGPTLHGWNID